MTTFNENIKPIRGWLEIIVQDHKTGEIVYHDPGRNQLQEWAKHSIAHLIAGRSFCTWGNHGEVIDDVGGTPVTLDHYKDGSNTEKVVNSPWSYSASLNGMVQKRDAVSGDLPDTDVSNGAPLYPFFPTKMRFGTGGLDAAQNPKDDVPSTATGLTIADSTCPFVVIDRERTTQHINLTEASSTTINKTTFSVKLPGGDAGYPYNGKIISEAGLFCDAALMLDDGTYNMRTGMMLAYRTFKGIVKDESIDVTFNWSLRM